MANICDLEEKKPLIPSRVDIGYGSNSQHSTLGLGMNGSLITHHNKCSNTPRTDNDTMLRNESQCAQKHPKFVDESNYCIKNSPDGTVFTYEQATTLMITLENTKNVLENYMHTLEDDEDRITPAPRRKSWWGLHCWPKKRKWLYRYITIVTVTLQFLNLLILSLLDAWAKPQKERPYVMASSVTMIILQLINLLFLILASGRLVKQIYRNSVNSVFLAQTYGATILLFAGLYTLTYRLQRHSWRFVNEDLYEDPVQVFILYAKFLFYSISTATLCGSDNVLPEEWFNCLFAGFQMLLSFCYFASILGAAMCHDNTPTTTPARPAPPSIPRQTHHKPNDHYHQHHKQYHQYHHPPHHHQQQHQCSCASTRQEINVNNDFTPPHQTACIVNGHPTLPNNNINEHPRHQHFCCNCSSLPKPSYSHPSQHQQCSRHTEHSPYQQHNSQMSKMVNQATLISILPQRSGEINPVFSNDGQRTVNLEQRIESCPLTESSDDSLEVGVLNPQHLQVDLKPAQ